MTFEIPRVKTCGCSLRAGSIIFGCLSVLGSLAVLVMGDELVGAESSEYVKVGRVIGTILALVIAICFLVGIKMEKPKLLTPYLVIQVCAAIFIIFRAVFSGGFSIIIAGLLLAILQVYCVIVIYSFRAEMKEKVDQKHSINNPV